MKIDPNKEEKGELKKAQKAKSNILNCWTESTVMCLTLNPYSHFNHFESAYSKTVKTGRKRGDDVTLTTLNHQDTLSISFIYSM